MSAQPSRIIKKAFCIAFLNLFLLSPVFSKVYINEISGNDKWLEVYNSESNSVNIGGYIIQKIDEDGVPADWLIPENTIIAAKGFLSWERDKNNVDGSTFTWGISAKKDVAFKMLDRNKTELDYFEVRSGLYSEGLSRTVGRETDGADKLVLFLEGGTRNTSNDNGKKQQTTENPKRIFVNEINGNRYNAGGFEQQKWLEIYNAENEAVTLMNYSIQKIDEKGSVSNWFIPEGVVIAAKGFHVWEQDSLCTDGSTFTWGISARKNVTFKLFDDNGTQLDIFDVDGEEGVGTLYSEGEGRTVGRKYDGSPELVIFPHDGTRGASNGTPPVGLNKENVTLPSAWVNSNVIHFSENVQSAVLIGVSGKTFWQENGLSLMEVDLSHLPAGIYLLKLSNGALTNIQKIILNR